jgi:DNA-binding SARP family transcriptional activator
VCEAAAAAALAHQRKMALLYYLAAAPDSPARTRDALLPLFWHRQNQSRARTALRQAIHVLRRVLDPDVFLTYGSECIAVNGNHVWCDAQAFQVLAREGRHEDALALYGGEFLTGFYVADAPLFDRWLETTRARLHETAASSASTLLACAVRSGDARQIARDATRVLELDSWDGPALAHLKQALAELGNDVGARVAEARVRRLRGLDMDFAMLEPA